MAGKRGAVRTEIVPAWQAFLSEAIPYRAAGAATAAAVGAEAIGSWSARSTAAAKLRRHIGGSVGQPTPESVWAIAETTKTIEGREWCAGPLFLFAAGHFERFAQTMSGANPNLLKADRFLALIQSVENACAPTQAESEAMLASDLRAEGIDDFEIHKQLRRRRSRGAVAIRPDRNAWILTDREEAALEQAFRHGPVQPSLAAVNARLAELHPEIGLAHQRAIVLTAVRGARL